MRAYPQDAPTSDYLHSRKAPHPRVPGRRTFFRYPHSRESRISAAIGDLYPLPFVFNCWTIRIPALRRAGARLRPGRRVGSEGRTVSTHVSFTRCRLCSNKRSANRSRPCCVRGPRPSIRRSRRRSVKPYMGDIFGVVASAEETTSGV